MDKTFAFDYDKEYINISLMNINTTTLFSIAYQFDHIFHICKRIDEKCVHKIFFI